MRSRAGPRGALVLIAALSLALGSLTGCATVARVGHVLEAAGETIGAIGGVLVDGAAKDLKSGTDAVGITAPATAPTVAPAPEAPKPEAPAVEPTSNDARMPDEDLVVLLEAGRWRRSVLQPHGALQPVYLSPPGTYRDGPPFGLWRRT